MKDSRKDQSRRQVSVNCFLMATKKSLAQAILHWKYPLELRIHLSVTPNFVKLTTRNQPIKSFEKPCWKPLPKIAVPLSFIEDANDRSKD